MESYRLKNIIIMILVILNGFLLVLLSVRRDAEQRSRLRVREQLVELFAQENIALNPDIILDTQPPSGYTLTQEPKKNQEVAAFFLGKDLSFLEQDDDLFQYSGDAGTVLFHDNGSFHMSASRPVADPENFCRDFCQKFDYENLTFSIESDGNGFATAVQTYHGYLVSNCTVTFMIKDDAVHSISGVFLSGDGTESDGSSLSGTAALNLFLSTVQKGAIITAITDLFPCYEFQSTIAAPLTLVPAWCIVADSASETLRFYINGYTGTVIDN